MPLNPKLRTIAVHFSCFLLPVLLLISCSTGGSGSGDIPPPPAGPSVYILGHEEVSGKIQTRYWKDGVGTTLSNYNHLTYATAIFVSGNDMHAVGNDYDNLAAAVYWKNNQIAQQMIFNNYYSLATDVFVSGSDVYICGTDRAGGVGKLVAKYWKNGTAVPVSNGMADAVANSIFVSGTDVYVVGEEHNGTRYVSKLWKNGVATPLTNPAYEGYASSVYVSGNDVYVAVNETDPVTFKSTARYWKNGTLYPLGTPGAFSKVESIVISGTDVYAAGLEVVGTKSVARYWKNGTAVPLADGSTATEAKAIFVYGNDVHVTGNEYAPINPGSPTHVYYIKYWKNGIGSNLSGPKATLAKGVDIFVK